MTTLLRYLCCCLAACLIAACAPPASVTTGTVPAVLTVSTFAGKALLNGTADGLGAAARFTEPAGVAADAAGNVYVADSSANTIRKITPGGLVSTLAGSGMPGNVDGQGSSAQFDDPVGIAVDSQFNVYVADSNNHTIRKITPLGLVSTLAGSGSPGSVNGQGSLAQFNAPHGIAVDSLFNVYVADTSNNVIRQITPGGLVSTLAGSGSPGRTNGNGAAASFDGPSSIALSAFGLYVTEFANDTIRKITFSAQGVASVSTLAGNPGNFGHADGKGAAASFNLPLGIAVDASGIVYVADTFNFTIRKIDPFGNVSTVAGLAGTHGSQDGLGPNARFFYPYGLAIDPSGNIFVGDYFNSTIRKVGPGYTLGGTVTGASGTLVLQNTNADSLTVSADGAFTMPVPVPAGAAYAITVSGQPVGQICAVSKGSGTATNHVADIAVNCASSGAAPVATKVIGGTVIGKVNTSPLMLVNSATFELIYVTTSGPFAFQKPEASLNPYGVQVATQAAGETCTVAGGTASLVVPAITITCVASTYTTSVIVKGLTTGNTLALQNVPNGGAPDILSIVSNATFAFATPITVGGSYNVTVLTQPVGQTCSLSNNLGGVSGTMAANVTIDVKCVTNPAPTFTIGGTVSGMGSGTLVLDNFGDNLSINANGPFTFAIPVNGYNVSVLTQPAGQTCVVTAGTGGGTASANVTNVAVTCSPNAAPGYTISGIVNGLTTPTLTLLNNGVDALMVFPSFSPGGNTPFTFAIPVPANTGYGVTVSGTPPGQTCTVTSGTGTANANVSNVVVTCQ